MKEHVKCLEDFRSDVTEQHGAKYKIWYFLCAKSRARGRTNLEFPLSWCYLHTNCTNLLTHLDAVMQMLQMLQMLWLIIQNSNMTSPIFTILHNFTVTSPPNWCHQSWHRHRGKLCSALQWSREPQLSLSQRNNRMPRTWRRTIRFRKMEEHWESLNMRQHDRHLSRQLILHVLSFEGFNSVKHAVKTFGNHKTPRLSTQDCRNLDDLKLEVSMIILSFSMFFIPLSKCQVLCCAKRPCLCPDTSLLAILMAIWFSDRSSSTLARSRTRDPWPRTEGATKRVLKCSYKYYTVLLCTTLRKRLADSTEQNCAVFNLTGSVLASPMSSACCMAWINRFVSPNLVLFRGKSNVRKAS